MTQQAIKDTKILESNHVFAILTRFSPLQFQVPLLYVALVQIDSVLSFGASLFGNRFLYRAQHYTTKPKQAYRLRKPYQDKYGPYGDNLIHTVRFICSGTIFLLRKVIEVGGWSRK